MRFTGTESSLSSSLAGGALMGAAASALMITTGKVAGFSGIFSDVISQRGWRSYAAAFTSGFVGASAYLGLYYPAWFGRSSDIGLSLTHYAVSGLLVGIGARLGSGCTSGHGICGLARLSRRSLAAVGTFMATAMLTATAWTSKHHLSTGATRADRIDASTAQLTIGLAGALALPALYTAYESGNIPNCVATVVCGAASAVGLVLSGMTNSQKVMSFLVLDKHSWDASLLFVMAGAAVTAAVGYHIARQNGKPLLGGEMAAPARTDIDTPLLLGAAVFGIGWGSAGLCPGPAVVNAAAGARNMSTVFVPAMLIGFVIGRQLQGQLAGTLNNNNKNKRKHF